MVEVERDEGPTPSLLDPLFTATQRRLLGLLFGQTEREFQVRELMELTGGGAGAIHRELQRLQGGGLVRASGDGYRVRVQANEDSPIHAPLAELVRNTVGLAEPLRAAFAACAPQARLLFAPRVWLPGESVRRDDALCLVLVAMPGRHPPWDEVLDARQLAEDCLGRACDMPIILEPTALRTPDEHVRWILEQPRTWIIGDEAVLKAMR